MSKIALIFNGSSTLFNEPRICQSNSELVNMASLAIQLAQEIPRVHWVSLGLQAGHHAHRAFL